MIKKRGAQRDIIRSEWKLDKRWGISAKRDETDYLALMERDKGGLFSSMKTLVGLHSWLFKEMERSVAF